MRGASRLARPQVWPWLACGLILVAVGLVWGSVNGWAGIEALPLGLGAGLFGVGVARVLGED